MSDFSLDLGLSGTHVLLTGAAGAIGSVTTQALLAAGCIVTAVDIKTSDMKHKDLHWIQANISSETEIEEAFEKALIERGLVQCCIALASVDLSYLPQHASLTDMPLDQWRRTFEINVQGTFLTARTWLRQIKDFATPETSNLGLIMIGSEAGTFGVTGNADYSAGKSAVQYGLAQSLKGDASKINRRARVNVVAPGPVDTPQYRKECAENPEELWLSSQATTAMGKPVSIESVAKTILFLASESWSENIHGEIIPVKSGKEGVVHWKQGEIKD